MQITSRFTIGVHIIAALEYFKKDYNVTSGFLAGSVGANPVLIRTIMGELKDAGLIKISQGKTGISLAKPIDEISFYDIYKALDCVEENGLFHFHENPNTSCPVGKNIHKAMDERLIGIQTTMESEMKKISVGDVYNDIKKEMDLQ
ncbi:MAG: Rrf2 family transcriptional regulator [Clostridia bacterium]|nr:Rrf2 family transcriptional regulator [Clostridia bacterium]